MRFKKVFVLAVLSLCVACARRPTDEPAVFPVGEEDAAMNSAMEKARASVDTFIAALQSGKAVQSHFAIKKKFSDGKHTEHIWLLPVTFDGTRFEGVVNNVPADLTGVAIGQNVMVEPNQISDWMYLENGKLMGGYTIRVLRDRMSPAERKEFDRRGGFVVE
jgi:uncharacterized protein YegJ (DUF2314 family)